VELAIANLAAWPDGAESHCFTLWVGSWVLGFGLPGFGSLRASAYGL